MRTMVESSVKNEWMDAKQSRCVFLGWLLLSTGSQPSSILFIIIIIVVVAQLKTQLSTPANMILRSLGAQARSQLRAYTTAASSASTSTTPKLAQLPRSTLHISGPDAQKFLKGQMCKDVDSLGGGYSGFLNASGRVLHTVFCVPVPNEPNSYLISSDANHPLPLHKLLPPFRLRAKVRIKDVSEAWDVYSAWGSEASPAPQDVWRFGNGGAAERLWSWDEGRTSLGLKEGEVGTWDLRAGWGAGGMGKLVFIPKGQSRECILREFTDGSITDVLV